jgi:hypothetical protein
VSRLPLPALTVLRSSAQVRPEFANRSAASGPLCSAVAALLSWPHCLCRSDRSSYYLFRPGSQDRVRCH